MLPKHAAMFLLVLIACLSTVDSLVGEFWVDSTVQGISCDSTCEDQGDGVKCKDASFTAEQVLNKASFAEASSMTCNASPDYAQTPMYSNFAITAPSKFTAGTGDTAAVPPEDPHTCFYDNKGAGTCAATWAVVTRVCPCQCGKGTYQPSANIVKTAAACLACGPGKFQDATGESECKNCGVGKWQDEEGKSECKNCPSDKSDGAGTTSESNCISEACLVGTYSETNGKGNCKDCDAGKFQDATGQSECKACPANSGSPAASDAEDDCLAAAGHTGSGVAVTKCAADTFKGTAGPEACTQCPDNSGTGDKTGSTAASDCVKSVPPAATVASASDSSSDSVSSSGSGSNDSGSNLWWIILLVLTVLGCCGFCFFKVAGGGKAAVKPDPAAEPAAEETPV